jgi:hypothetical protein
MVIEDLINEDEKPAVMRALLLKHRHVNDSGQTFPFGPRRKFSSYSSLQVIFYLLFVKYGSMVCLKNLARISFR